MKKISLIALLTSSALLVGCGQDIEKIEGDINASLNTKSNFELEGYVATIDKDIIKDAKDFRRANKISSSLKLDENYDLVALKKPDYTPDEFDIVEDIHVNAKERLAALEEQAKEQSIEIIAKWDSKKAEHQQEINAINASLSEYNAFIAKEQSAFDKVKTKTDEFRAARDSSQKLFAKDVRTAIIEEELPYDADHKFKLRKQYDIRFVNASKLCNSAKDSSKAILLGKANVKKPGQRCLIINEGISNERIVEIVKKHATIHETARYNIDLYEDELSSANKALTKAQIIAKNKTGIKIRSVKKTLSRLESKISIVERSSKSASEVNFLKQKLVNSDSEYRELKSKYLAAVSKYHIAIGKKAQSMITVDIEQFNDENDAYDLDADENGIAFFVLKSKGRDKMVFAGRLSSSKEPKSFYQVFQKARNVSRDMTFESEDELRKLVVEQAI